MDTEDISAVGRRVLAFRKRAGLSIRQAADAGAFGAPNSYRHYEINFPDLGRTVIAQSFFVCAKFPLA
jgi:hypothetical protein